jgi:hypothetical protein
MSNKDLQNGGTHGSPVGPLLHVVDAFVAPGPPPGKARLRPTTSATERFDGSKP